MNISQGEARKRRPWGMITAVILVLFIASCAALMKVYGDAREKGVKRAFMVEAFSASGQLKKYFDKFGKLPATPQEVGISPHYEVNWGVHDTTQKAKFSYDLSLNRDSIIVVFTGISEKGPATLIFRPVSSTVPAVWDCTGGTLEDEYRPEKCRKKST
jgi:hypothetical protein